MKKITAKYIEKYLKENYGGSRHDVEAMAESINEVCKHYGGLDTKQAFEFIIGDRDGVDGAWFTSYGFNTREGREFNDLFAGCYYHITREGGTAEEYINYEYCN